MTIQLVKTREYDGDWFKIRLDDSTVQCIMIKEGKETEAMNRAFEIFEFIKENKGQYQVIKSEEVL